MGLELFECCGNLFCECNFKDEPVMQVNVGRVYKHYQTGQRVLVKSVNTLFDKLTMVYYQSYPRDHAEICNLTLVLGKFRDQYEEVPLPEAGSTWMHHTGKPYTVIAVSNTNITKKDWLPACVTYQACGEDEIYTRPLAEFYTSFELISPSHSVECLYVYQLSLLNLQDTPSLRIAHWDYHNALEWNGDSPKVPDASIADCHTRCPACLHSDKK